VAAGGVSYAATGSSVNIADPVTATSKAKVTPGGKLWVGDGAGYVTVDGSVRPAAPASPWSASVDFPPNQKVIAGPSSLPINVTSLSVSARPTGNDVEFSLHGLYIPSSATDCLSGTLDATLWLIRDTGDGVTPLSFSFPTPLQYNPPANTKACLYAAVVSGGPTVRLNASGFYGG